MPFLPIGMRRFTIFQELLPWFEEGKSASAFYEVIKGTELGIRRQEFFALAREARSAVNFGRTLADLSPSDVPRRRDMPHWPFSSGAGARYRVRYESIYLDAEGNQQSKYFDLHYTRLHTMREFNELASPVTTACIEFEAGTPVATRVSHIWAIGE